MIDAVMTSPPPPPPPPPPALVVAGPRRKLSHTRTLLVAGGIIAVLVVIITVVATRVASSGAQCAFYCGPKTGPLLTDEKTFTNNKWHFVIDYGGANLTLNTSGPSGSDPNGDSADLLATDSSGNGAGEIVITGMPQTSTQSAIQAALDLYSNLQFSDIRPVEAVPGAEIGLVQGDGQGYTGVLASSDGSSGTDVGIQIMAVTHGNETLVASMWSPIQKDVSAAPFYLFAEQSFDHVLTDLQFTGG